MTLEARKRSCHNDLESYLANQETLCLKLNGNNRFLLCRSEAGMPQRMRFVRDFNVLSIAIPLPLVQLLPAGMAVLRISRYNFQGDERRRVTVNPDQLSHHVQKKLKLG